MSRDEGVALRWTEAALALLLLGLFLAAKDLPLVDLPQHALQLANWVRLDAGDPSVADLELNFRTPYLLAYPIARVLCVLFPVLTALKLVLWASVVLGAFAFRRLCQELGHTPWLGLLGYPLGLGYSFCFGFVAFCAALPLAYLAMAQLWSHRRVPSAKSGLTLALTLGLLLVAHGVALAFLLLVTGPLLLQGGGKLWERVWPLSSPPLLGAAWLAPGGTSTRLGGDLWAPELGRWVELPAQLVGIGAIDFASTLLGLLLLAVAACSLGAPRSRVCFAPLLLVLAGYGAFPLLFRGAGPLHPRFSSYLIPALLFAFMPRPTASSHARRVSYLAIGVAVIGLFGWRLAAFNGETADFHQLAARLPPGLSVRPLVFERGGRAFPGTPAHLHLPAYYSVSQGGSPGYSFAMYSTSVVRFRAGVHVRMSGGSEWAPERFDAAREANDYEYFLVRSSYDRSLELFPGACPAAQLEHQVGAWWGYRRNSDSLVIR